MTETWRSDKPHAVKLCDSEKLNNGKWSSREYTYFGIAAGHAEDVGQITESGLVEDVAAWKHVAGYRRRGEVETARLRLLLRDVGRQRSALSGGAQSYRIHRRAVEYKLPLAQDSCRIYKAFSH